MLPLLTAALLGLVSAQYANDSAIASCDDFQCAESQSENVANCHVQGHNYSAVGMVSYKTPYENFTWTEGSKFTYPSGNPRYPTYVKDWWLGTPSTIDLRQEKTYHGCAAFFVDSNASFPLYQQPGQCSSVLGDECTKKLWNEASLAAAGSSSSKDLCQKLESAFTHIDVPMSCNTMSLGGSWGRIKYKPLTGPSAPPPPTQAGDSLSNCNPVIPGDYQLSFALNFNASGGNGTEDSIFDSSMRGIPDGPDDVLYFVQLQAVPIVSVFAPASGNGDVYTSVSCLDTPVKTLVKSTTNAQDPDTHDGAASMVGISFVCIVAVFLVNAWFLTL